VILIATISVSVVILLNSNYENEDFDNFTFDAVYLKNSNSILITFDDANQKSSFAILEILGMEKTFHEEFAISNSKFTKLVPIDNIPKYGWKTTPVTLEITYDESIIFMKTEIHDEGKMPSPIIFSQNEL
tara:strand:- start:20 stop:409 length:390 start_codon:yes stop_codon:yes gene_type:complete